MNPYGVNTHLDNILAPLTSLKVLYEGMPATTGCEKCQEINGDEETWCCKTQNPSMYYSEFLVVWETMQTWAKNDKARAIIASIENCLSNNKDKGCALYDGKCTVYEDRPFACRMYGVVPKKNWEKRWEQLKKRDGDEFCAKPQCNLVSTVDGKEITPEQEDKWFSHTVKSEERLGVPDFIIKLYDDAGGSYRTFHDHILLELFPPETLDILTKVKLTNPSKEDIESTAEVIWNHLQDAGVV